MGIMNKIKGMLGVEELREEDYYNTQEVDINPEGAPAIDNEEDRFSHAITGGTIQVAVVSPRSFEEVGDIAKNLIEKKTVVMNLEHADRENARRILDFLSGVLFTIDGQIKRTAVNNYVVTPSGVDVSGDEVSDASDISNFTDSAESDSVYP